MAFFGILIKYQDLRKSWGPLTLKMTGGALVFFKFIANKTLKICLKVLYLSTIATLVVWSLPIFNIQGSNPTSIAHQVGKLTGPAFKWSGLWHGWSMFAPNPSNLNFTIQVAIEFYDGTYEFFTMPQLHKMSRWDAFIKERHRKFTENINRDNSKHLWPHLADHYESQYAVSHGPVKQIDFVRWWTTVPQANFKKPPPSTKPDSMDYEESYLFYSAEYSKP